MDKIYEILLRAFNCTTAFFIMSTDGTTSSANESGEGAGPRSDHLSQSAVPSADILKKAVVQFKALII